MENNIFKFATKELSQDAFLAWLVNWINIPRNKENNDIKNLAKEFVRNIIKEKEEWVKFLDSDEDNIEIKCDVQYYHIDVLVSIHNKKTDKYLVIIIEDKVQSLEHDSQIDRYKDSITDNFKNDIEKEDIIEKDKLDDILTCYYKPYDECGINLKKVDCIYVRKRQSADDDKIYGIYELLQKYEQDINQEYFKDYLEYIKAIEECASKKIVNSVIDYKERKKDIIFFSFFKEIETEFLKEKGYSDEEVEKEYIGVKKEKKKEDDWKKIKISVPSGKRVYFGKSTSGNKPTWWCNIPINLKIKSDLFNNYAFIKINFYEKEYYNKKNDYTIMLRISKKEEPISDKEEYENLQSNKNFKQENGKKFEVRNDNHPISYYVYKLYNKYYAKKFDQTNIYNEVVKLFEDENIILNNIKYKINPSGDGSTKTQPEINIFTINIPAEEEKSFDVIKGIIEIIKGKLENNTIVIKSREDSNILDAEIKSEKNN